jgi:hypothetical protein
MLWLMVMEPRICRSFPDLKYWVGIEEKGGKEREGMSKRGAWGEMDRLGKDI